MYLATPWLLGPKFLGTSRDPDQRCNHLCIKMAKSDHCYPVHILTILPGALHVDHASAAGLLESNFSNLSVLPITQKISKICLCFALKFVWDLLTSNLIFLHHWLKSLVQFFGRLAACSIYMTGRISATLYNR